MSARQLFDFGRAKNFKALYARGFSLLAAGIFVVCSSCSDSEPKTIAPSLGRNKVEILASAEKGDRDAQNALGEMYASGEGVPVDFAKAKDWYLKAANQGSAKAQYNLGTIYASGLGVSLDAVAALTWFQKAASNYLVDAQFAIGQAYSTGAGVAINQQLAAKWFNQAAEHGDAQSQYTMARRYLEGNGVPIDRVKAYQWLRLASIGGITDAERYLSDTKSKLSSEQLAIAEKAVKTLLTK